ncbi:MAG: hypothetical protein ACYDAJ_06185 [Nitrosotalea sp.]
MMEHVFFVTNGIRELGGEVPDLPESLDFATGIFAAFLLVVSLFAYRRTKLTRLLFVSAAFGIYAFRALLPRLDIFLPNLDISTGIDVMLSSTGFVILALFFLAIVKRK